MAITKNSMPSIIPTRALALDTNLSFMAAASPRTAAALTATGYYGDPTQLDVGVGRIDGYWCIDITAIDFSSGDESYKLFLMGSNDVAWGNGNIDILACRDFAAVTGGRLVTTIAGATPTIPASQMGGGIFAVPFTNQMNDYIYRYLRAYAVIAGTTPSITALTWITPDTNG